MFSACRVFLNRSKRSSGFTGTLAQGIDCEVVRCPTDDGGIVALCNLILHLYISHLRRRSVYGDDNLITQNFSLYTTDLKTNGVNAFCYGGGIPDEQCFIGILLPGGCIDGLKRCWDSRWAI